MRRSLLTYEKIVAREIFGGSEGQAFWFVEDVKADMAELAQKLDEAGRTADARKVVIEQRDDRIATLEAENAELRQSIKAAWLLGRKAWCPAAILDDHERTERDWQQALAALEDKT